MSRYCITQQTKIVCPYCGYEDSNNSDKVDIHEGNAQEISCGRCDEEFRVYVNIVPEYTTGCLIDKHKWVEAGVAGIVNTLTNYEECERCGALCRKSTPNI